MRRFSFKRVLVFKIYPGRIDGLVRLASGPREAFAFFIPSCFPLYLLLSNPPDFGEDTVDPTEALLEKAGGVVGGDTIHALLLHDDFSSRKGGRR